MNDLILSDGGLTGMRDRVGFSKGKLSSLVMKPFLIKLAVIRLSDITGVRVDRG